MNQCFKNEEAELNIYPMGLILLETYVNISFCNNINNFVLKMKVFVKLDIHKKVFVFLN